MTSWRYLVQRATTGEWLHTDLPLNRDVLRWELSGAGVLSGTLAPDLGGMLAEDGKPLLDEWGSLVYAEAGGIIRWGGIVIASRFERSHWRAECAGFATYPHGIPYGDKYTQIGVDPATVIRHLWAHVQASPDGDLGVKVSNAKTPVRLGTPANGKETAEPYELTWWDHPDVGGEIDTLAATTPLDYTERHAWNTDRTDVTHEIVLGYPRLGRRRTDLSFTLGDNVTNIGAPEWDGDRFANEVIGVGAGEGAGSLHRTAAVRDGRLRRPYLYLAKDVSSRTRLDALIRDERIRRQQPLTIPSVTVKDHPHAPIASWDVGDDILIQATLPWLGDVALWHRIVGWDLLTEHTAALSLERSDSFTYGG